MMRTGIPVSVLEAEGNDVIMTVVDLINAEARAERVADEGFIDPEDPATIPEGWR